MSVELEGFEVYPDKVARAKAWMAFEDTSEGSQCRFGARAHLSGEDFSHYQLVSVLFVLVYRANRCESRCD